MHLGVESRYAHGGQTGISHNDNTSLFNLIGAFTSGCMIATSHVQSSLGHSYSRSHQSRFYSYNLLPKLQVDQVALYLCMPCDQ